MALQFTAAFKNANLDLFTGRSTSLYKPLNAAGSAGSTPYLKLKNSGGTSLVGTNGTSMIGAWSTVIAGTSTLSLSESISTTGTVDLMSFYENGGTIDFATGVARTAGTGGNIVLPSLSVTSGTPVLATAVLKVPTLSGGTLNFNQALATAFANTLVNHTSLPAMAASGCKISFYDGTQPATADTAISGQTLTGYYNFAAGTDFAAASAGNTVCGTKTLTSGNTTGATWFRWQNAAQTYTVDGSVGASGADCIASSSTQFSLTLYFP